MVDPVYIYRAVVTRVIDGDTYITRIDLGFRASLEISLRLHGVDCPEMPTDEGKAATAFVRALLTNSPVLVQTYRDQRTFARWVADVWIDGQSLAEVLVAAGHAKPLIGKNP